MTANRNRELICEPKFSFSQGNIFLFERAVNFINHRKYLTVCTPNTQYTSYTHFSRAARYFGIKNRGYLKFLTALKYWELTGSLTPQKNPPRAAGRGRS
jgi:hypothetical protein